MPHKTYLKLNIVAALTAISGLVTLGSTLAALGHHHRALIVITDAHLTVLAGISLIYLATLLRRGKYNAWLISLPIYAYLIVRNYRHFVIDFRADERFVPALLNLLLPVIILGLLLDFRRNFNVRSEVRSFTIAVRRAILILMVAFLYGLAGFALMDEHDFHQELSVASSAHYTIDQFGLTTNRQITPYTERAHLFLDSLAAVSLGSVFYAAVSFFAPIRFRLIRNRKDYNDALALLKKHSSTSEDFFKLWPPDKIYFFSGDRRAVIAYKVVNGVALAVGDPVGPKKSAETLTKNFLDYCWVNDWSPAFIHVDGHNLKIYEKLGLGSQKIGEEALVDVGHFNKTVATNKYFRHISNKFSKQGYQCELLSPPHSPQTIARLAAISQDWLKIPGKTERGFMMGYFSEVYMQACDIMVARDQDGQIQAFLNRVPSYKKGEANFDFLRSASSAPSNANDYIMINFIRYLGDQGVEWINMGLSPLSGLGPDKSADRSAIDSLLHFVYDAADRFYSFQGLARFKAKYEPQWESRFIIYRGGLPGFTRTMNSLLRAMRVK